jgi:type 1 fimbriae regulatory protein FimB/type 1 fimbriae regulatory protein FimE
MTDSKALKIEQRIAPIRGSNLSRREREFLTKPEIDKLLKQCRDKRVNAQRDYCIILLGYKHGLRASEFGMLTWASVDFDKATIYIRRAKGSDSGMHHLSGAELRELRKWKRIQGEGFKYVFTGNTDVPLSAPGVSAIVKRLGVDRSGKNLLGYPIHAHMLRHTCGYLLAESGVDLRIIQSWLGHREIQNTTIYTKLSSKAFEGIDI